MVVHSWYLETTPSPSILPFVVNKRLGHLRRTGIVSIHDWNPLTGHNAQFCSLIGAQCAVYIDIVVLAHPSNRDDFVQGEEDDRADEKPCNT